MIYIVFLIIWLSVNSFMAVKHCREKTMLIVNGIFLVTIAGLRGINIGRDVKSYGAVFATSGKLSYLDIITKSSAYLNMVTKSSDGMLGYRLLAKTIYMLTGGSYQFMLFVSSAITVYGVLKFAYRYSPNAVASVFYFVTICYYFESLNLVRQWIAISLVLLSIIAYDEHKYLKLICLSVSAVLVHNMVIITLVPLFAFRLIKWNKMLFCIYTIGLIVLMISIPYFIRLFISLFPRYSMYAFVLNEGYAGQGFGGVARGRRAILSAIFLLIIIFAIIQLKESTLSMDSGYPHKPAIRNWFWTFASMVMIEIVIGIMFYNNIFYGRIQTLFSFFTIFMIPTVIERLKKKWRLLAYIGTNMVFLLSTVIKMFPVSDISPYQFFWQ